MALLQPQACSVPRLDPDGRCDSENIKVFDGSSTSGPLLGKVCSKNDFVPVFESSSNSLTFQIVTGLTSVQRSVFIFYYFFSSDTCKLSLTHPSHSPLQIQVTTAPAGDIVLSSPGWRICVPTSQIQWPPLKIPFFASGEAQGAFPQTGFLARQIWLIRQLQADKCCV